MKRLFCIILLLPAMISAQKTSHENVIGVPRFETGIILGEPLGISAKWWHTRFTAADAAAAFSFQDGGKFEAYVDYLFHPVHLMRNRLPMYFGLGLAFRVGEDSFIGARTPIGVEYFLPGMPLSLFAELGPVWEFSPRSHVNGTGGIGMRFTFGKL
jgi:hypothetical protein